MRAYRVRKPSPPMLSCACAATAPSSIETATVEISSFFTVRPSTRRAVALALMSQPRTGVAAEGGRLGASIGSGQKPGGTDLLFQALIVVPPRLTRSTWASAGRQGRSSRGAFHLDRLCPGLALVPVKSGRGVCRLFRHFGGWLMPSWRFAGKASRQLFATEAALDRFGLDQLGAMRALLQVSSLQSVFLHAGLVL